MAAGVGPSSCSGCLIVFRISHSSSCSRTFQVGFLCSAASGIVSITLSVDHDVVVVMMCVQTDGNSRAGVGLLMDCTGQGLGSAPSP